MNNYNQPLSSREASELEAKHPKILAYYPHYYPFDGDKYNNPAPIGTWHIGTIYRNNRAVYTTREDYAMYVKGNKQLPEGYGYPNKELGKGTYNGLQWAYNGVINDSELTFFDNEQTVEQWFEVAFKLEDLARVENTLATEEEDTKELIEREMPDPAVGLRERIIEQPTYAQLEQQIEDLQSTIILQKSKTKVLISYYKDRAKLEQAILKLEEELING